MVFSSLIFCFAFLPANLILYYFCNTTKAKNIVLLLFSIVFYSWGEPVYILILMAMAFFCWVFSRCIDSSQNQKARKFWLFCAVVICIGSIGYFKYIGFAVETINSIIGLNLLPVPNVDLPIGISFYTFQLLTYVIDVYRREVPAQKKYWRILLYASLFHQCIAGPIVRYGDVENELTERTTDINDISKGLTRFACGLAKKSILANGCGAVADTLLLTDAAIGNATELSANIALLESRSALALWIGMAFYMLQIYLDFSAYSDMAIGMGLMCGFHYKENFDYPYISTSVTEFWRRWHMSLGTFFRDYVYIPLGGNRKGSFRQIINLFIVWSLTGLWHGAAWNFVLWGLYFFVLLVFEKFVFGKFLNNHKYIGRIYLLITVFFGWVFFKFTNFTLLQEVLQGMFCLNGNKFYTFEIGDFASKYILFFIICVIACVPIVAKIKNYIIKKAQESYMAFLTYKILDIALPIILILLSTISLVGEAYNPFLYFQF